MRRPFMRFISLCILHVAPPSQIPGRGDGDGSASTSIPDAPGLPGKTDGTGSPTFPQCARLARCRRASGRGRSGYPDTHCLSHSDGDAAVFQGFHDTDVGVVEGGVFSHQSHGHLVGGVSQILRHGDPVRKIRGRAFQLQALRSDMSKKSTVFPKKFRNVLEMCTFIHDSVIALFL